MQTISISELRANLRKYLERASRGDAITVTTNGRLLATITPPIQHREMAKQQLQQLALGATIRSPVGPVNEEWDALK